jgi:hypothetical protein
MSILWKIGYFFAWLFIALLSNFDVWDDDLLKTKKEEWRKKAEEKKQAKESKKKTPK